MVLLSKIQGLNYGAQLFGFPKCTHKNNYFNSTPVFDCLIDVDISA